MKKTANTHYPIATIILHWLVAVLVLGLFALGYWMVDLNYYHSWYKSAPALHKSLGLLVFSLMLIRLAWRLYLPPISALASHPKWQQKLSHGVHWLLYLLVFGIVVSGYLIAAADDRAIAFFNWFSVPASGELFNQQADIAGLWHRYAAYTLILIVALHAAAAFKHHFIDKDQTLTRMLGYRRDKSE